MRNRKTRGICFIAFGCGIILARVLPMGALILVTGIALICLGRNCMKR